MTSSGKVRIYELSKDLGLENKDVLDAAEKLSIAAKSHSSSISDAEAGQIRSLLKSNGNGSKASVPAKPAPGKAILSVKKAAPAKPTPAQAKPAAPAKPAAAKPATAVKPVAKPQVVAAPARPAPVKASAPPAPAKPVPRPAEIGRAHV